MRAGLGWIVDADGSGDFDRIDRTRRREVRRQRVNEGREVCLMGQWLRAGVMEAGVLTHPETGVVPGGGIAPRLATIFRHQGRDAWCEQEGRPRRQGRGFLSRLADAFVIGCALAGDARRSRAVLPKRLARLGLRMQPTKTASSAFRKPEAHHGDAPGNGTFAVLGLTHYWSRSRRGFGGIQRRTARQRLWRTKQSLWRWGHSNRHAPLTSQYQQLCQK